MIRNERKLRRSDQHEHALRAIVAGIEAAHPQTVIDSTVSVEESTLSITGSEYALDDFERILVLGGGKPAGAIAQALEAVLGARLPGMESPDTGAGGLVVTNTPVTTETITTHEGSHPVPTKENIEGTAELLRLAAAAGPKDLVLVVVSGGASALLCAPVEEISLEEYRELTDALLRSGASIDEFNAVRKHISRLKGGQLARTLAPATPIGLVFSDVVGNSLDVIGSGPTAPDTSTYTDALSVLERYEIEVPESISTVLDAGVRGERPETPDKGDSLFETVENHVLADNRTALDGASAICKELGYTPAILSARIEGAARKAGQFHASIARECLDTGGPFDPPVALLSGGETTVTVSGNGTGGPNQEFALAAALEIQGERVVLASVDTDGIDGPTDVAGALVDGQTVDSKHRRDDAQQALAANDSYTYLDSRDRLIETGPTGTNVNDLRVLLIGSE